MEPSSKISFPNKMTYRRSIGCPQKFVVCVVLPHKKSAGTDQTQNDGTNDCIPGILSDAEPDPVETGFLYLNILPPTRKKVAFVFFVVKSLSNLGKSMGITKLIRKISF